MGMKMLHIKQRDSTINEDTVLGRNYGFRVSINKDFILQQPKLRLWEKTAHQNAIDLYYYLHELLLPP